MHVVDARGNPVSTWEARHGKIVELQCPSYTVMEGGQRGVFTTYLDGDRFVTGPRVGLDGRFIANDVGDLCRRAPVALDPKTQGYTISVLTHPRPHCEGCGTANPGRKSMEGGAPHTATATVSVPRAPHH